MRKDSHHIVRVQVMQKAVYQDEIESLFRSHAVVPNVSDNKLPALALARVSNIAFVEVNSQIIGAVKVVRVGTRPTGHIEHPAGPLQIVMRENGRKLLLGKRGLPQAIHESALKYARRQTH